MNNDSRDDGIPAEQFQILKDDAVKGLHSVCQQILHIEFSLQPQRKEKRKRKHEFLVLIPEINLGILPVKIMLFVQNFEKRCIVFVEFY